MFSTRLFSTFILFLIGAIALSGFAGRAMAEDKDDSGKTPATSERTVVERVTTVREKETKIVEHEATDDRVRTVAIFVKNRAENVPDEKVTAMEDLITARIGDAGFHVMSREDTINSVKEFAKAGPNKGDDNLAGADLDKILSNNTSALRLAQNMGADYVLVASITTYGQETNEYEGNGIKTNILQTKMRATYKLLDASVGGSLSGDVVEVSRKDRAQAGQKIKYDAINDLLDSAAQKISAAMIKKAQAGKIREGPKDKGMAQFDVRCGMADLAIPEIVKNDKGEYVVTANQYRVEAMAVTVAVDGVVVGTTPGPFQAHTGLSKIRFTRDGFKDWEQTINIRDGLLLNVAMQMTDAGYRRWRENAAFLNDLKADAKMTDAQVKAWEGFAKMLEQSGYRIDVRKNVNVNENITGTNDSRTTVQESKTIVHESGAPSTMPAPSR